MSDYEEILNRAKTLLEGGKGDEARITLLELLKEDPQNSAALLMLGGAYFYEKKYAEAEMVYERLIQAEPGSGMLSIALFNTLWKQGRFDEAAGEIRRFIAVADKEKEHKTLEQYAAISKAIAEGEFEQGE
jgi:predicted Zn-dependent protease